MQGIDKRDLGDQLPGAIPRARTEGLVEVEGRYYPAPARPRRRPLRSLLRSIRGGGR